MKKALYSTIFRQAWQCPSITICSSISSTAPVAIIKNARSDKMGKKDILKVECDVNMLDLDVLGFIDHNITVNVIKSGDIVEKKELKLPKQIKNVIRCKNPRCITSIEQELPQIFVLADPNKEVYRCKYCEEKFDKQNL